jgi:hypothetical protein
MRSIFRAGSHLRFTSENLSEPRSARSPIRGAGAAKPCRATLRPFQPPSVVVDGMDIYKGDCGVWRFAEDAPGNRERRPHVRRVNPQVPAKRVGWWTQI